MQKILKNIFLKNNLKMCTIVKIPSIAIMKTSKIIEVYKKFGKPIKIEKTYMLGQR